MRLSAVFSSSGPVEEEWGHSPPVSVSFILFPTFPFEQRRVPPTAKGEGASNTVRAVAVFDGLATLALADRAFFLLLLALRIVALCDSSLHSCIFFVRSRTTPLSAKAPPTT